MAPNYPTNPEQAGQYHSPDEFEDKPDEHRTMTALEIGVIVGAIIAFFLITFFVFFYRHLEQRARAKRAARRAEEANGHGPVEPMDWAPEAPSASASQPHGFGARLSRALKGNKEPPLRK